MIDVLIVEDSAVVREFLTHLLNSDPNIRVIATATNGEEALKILENRKPDVITMDINMPKMDGFEATRKIMEVMPTPIVIVSGSWNHDEVATTFRAVEAGALAVVPRPNGIGHPEYQKTTSEFLQTVKLMSEVKVVRRWPRHREKAGHPIPDLKTPSRPEIRIVAVGASTGGPIILQTILSKLSKDIPAPILIVQHMASGFIQGFVEWLSQSSGFPVRVATHLEQPIAGHAYIAPDGIHMGVSRAGLIELSTDEVEHGLRPSVSFLFRSVSKVFGANAAGVLLTGMGKDGAEELRAMRQAGALTLVQDQESSVVWGMPGEAVRLNAADYVLDPERIAIALDSSLKGRGGGDLKRNL